MHDTLNDGLSSQVFCRISITSKGISCHFSVGYVLCCVFLCSCDCRICWKMQSCNFQAIIVLNILCTTVYSLFIASIHPDACYRCCYHPFILFCQTVCELSSWIYIGKTKRYRECKDGALCHSQGFVGFAVASFLLISKFHPILHKSIVW